MLYSRGRENMFYTQRMVNQSAAEQQLQIEKKWVIAKARINYVGFENDERRLKKNFTADWTFFLNLCQFYLRRRSFEKKKQFSRIVFFKGHVITTHIAEGTGSLGIYILKNPKFLSFFFFELKS